MKTTLLIGRGLNKTTLTSFEIEINNDKDCSLIIKERIFVHRKSELYRETLLGLKELVHKIKQCFFNDRKPPKTFNANAEKIISFIESRTPMFDYDPELGSEYDYNRLKEFYVETPISIKYYIETNKKKRF